MPLPAALEHTIAQYTTWIDGELRKEQNASKIGDTLYHYTSVAGLEGILKSEAVWLTDFRHMNDPSEISHGIELCRDVIRLRKPSVAHLTTWVNGEHTQITVEGLRSALHLTFSLSKTQPIRDRMRSHSSARSYDLETAAHRHDTAMAQSEQIFLDAANAHGELLANKDIGIPFMQDLARAVIAAPLIWNCLTSKHPAYAHEQEVQLIILGMHDRLRPYIKTRIRGADIVPYVAYDMPVRKEHSIGRIVVGPAANPDAERTVRTMLESFGIQHDIPVTRSLIPYRAL